MTLKILFLIITLSFLLRFYQLGIIPISLNWDENSNLYNAYSILKTGRDEYGKKLPLYNKSFNDYKPPLYMYLNVITVAAGGMNPLTSRFPSAFFGTLTVLVLFMTTKILTNKTKISLLSALFLCVSPWHINLSRVGFEANLGLFFTIVSFLFFFKSVDFESIPQKINKILFLTTAFLFGVSFYSYHSVRIFIPLMFIATTIIYREKIFLFSKKYILTFFIVAGVVVLPFFLLSPKEALFTRLKSTLVSTSEQNVASPQIKILENYLIHFDPNFLFIEGDGNPRHQVKGFAPIYIYQLPLIIIGLYLLVKKRRNNNYLIISWLLLAPIAAAPTTETPHALRALLMIAPLQVASGISLNTFINVKKSILYFIFIFLAFYGLFSYLHDYYFHYPNQSARAWQYGYHEAALETEKVKNNYNKIYIDPSLEEAYIFWLTAIKYEPIKFQKENTQKFDKYYFSGIPSAANELFVSSADSFPATYDLVKVINMPDGTEAIKMGHPR